MVPRIVLKEQVLPKDGMLLRNVHFRPPASLLTHMYLQDPNLWGKTREF